MTRALVIGHSHTNAVAVALKRNPAAGISVSHMLTLGRKLGVPDAQVVVPGTGNGAAFDERIHDWLDRRHESMIFSMIGGNVNNVFGLLQLQQPFDFILPWQQDLPVNAGFPFVTFGSITATFFGQAEGFLKQIEALGRYARRRGIPVCHLGSPPPIGDDAHILKHLDPYFRQERFARKPLTERNIRYKLWRLDAYITERHCADVGVRFVPPPPESRDGEGFLRPEYYADNATHANDRYGDLVIAQISGILAEATGSAE